MPHDTQRPSNNADLAQRKRLFGLLALTSAMFAVLIGLHGATKVLAGQDAVWSFVQTIICLVVAGTGIAERRRLSRQATRKHVGDSNE